ncbi:MAG: T9SS type A sorting domain-containing protein [Bacteroidales bacterium]|nr:T9SS type A sorting domain-containing protein [Bacteroidales bacterium]
MIYDSNGVIIPAGQPTEYTTWNLWYIFPILSQDTDFSLLDSCPAVGNVWIDTAGGGSVLRWDTDTLHAQWRLGISDTGDAHNTLYLDTLLEVPYINLDSLGIEPPFSVQVRPQCLCYEYCEVWGDWGDCTEFLPAPVPDTCRPVENLQFVRTGRRAGTLTWIPDTIQTLWEVSVGLVDGDVSDTFFDTIVTVPFLDIDSTMAPAVFTAHVRAICGEDNLSDWVSVTVDGTDTCRPVENLQFVRTGRRAGTLTWIPDTLQTLWQVSVGLVGGDVSEAFFDTIVSAPFLDIDSSMAPTVFTAHVRAICGEDYLSVWVSVTADPYVSVSQTMAPDIQLVPNPADGLVRVASSDGLRGIEVYDITGRRMLAFTATSTEVSFNVSYWSAGTYIVILRTIAGASVQRLVVE